MNMTTWQGQLITWVAEKCIMFTPCHSRELFVCQFSVQYTPEYLLNTITWTFPCQGVSFHSSTDDLLCTSSNLHWYTNKWVKYKPWQMTHTSLTDFNCHRDAGCLLKSTAPSLLYVPFSLFVTTSLFSSCLLISRSRAKIPLLWYRSLPMGSESTMQVTTQQQTKGILWANAYIMTSLCCDCINTCQFLRSCRCEAQLTNKFYLTDNKCLPPPSMMHFCNLRWFKLWWWRRNEIGQKARLRSSEDFIAGVREPEEKVAASVSAAQTAVEPGLAVVHLLS